MRPTVGILKPGSTFADMILRFGDYDAWFTRALGSTVRTRVHGPDGRLPDRDSADAWIITGARGSVLDDDVRVDRLKEWIRDAVEEEVPLLGVCYGHQAVAAALGGRVERHPAGWELGTVEIELTEAGRSDPLFAGYPARFLVQTTHEDQVVEAPPEAALLARNDHSPFQALAIGSACRTVQFHPEVDAPIARDFVDRRRHLIERPPSVAEAPLGGRLLVNFVRSFVPAAAAEHGRPSDA
ncbi:MAG: glutamine amidotransferase-related protein [Gemmatimonadota bacterium]